MVGLRRSGLVQSEVFQHSPSLSTVRRGLPILKLPTYQNQRPVNSWTLTDDQRRAIAEQGWIICDGLIISSFCSARGTKNHLDYLAMDT